MLVQPYLSFGGRCEEAIEFYKAKLGAEVILLSRFSEIPDPGQAGMVPPGYGNKIMHANLRIGESTVFASDGGAEKHAGFHGIALSITVKQEAEAERLFTALSDGGQVRMPFTKTFFSPGFGILTDRFGVCWMVYVVP